MEQVYQPPQREMLHESEILLATKNYKPKQTRYQLSSLLLSRQGPGIVQANRALPGPSGGGLNITVLKHFTGKVS